MSFQTNVLSTEHSWISITLDNLNSSKMKRSLLRLRAKIKKAFPVKMRRNWDDASYLAANPDVKPALEDGIVSSGIEHWQGCRLFEGRRLTRMPPKVDRDFPQYG